MATNLFGYPATIGVALSDQYGNAALVRCTVANIPSGAAGYAVGCLLQATDTGGIYTNTGSVTSSTFTLLEDAGGNFTLPITATDSSTTTGNSVAFTQSAITSGTGMVQTLAAMTTGIGHKIVAAIATLTTGRYYSANDGATEVFGIGANGHIHSTVSASAPSIAVTTQAGITAAAITAGGSDTCGIITTTGTSTGSTVLDVTFGKTYTVAPKGVILVPANASAAMPNTGYYVSAVSATGFTITVAAGGTYAATPSFRYVVIA